MLSVGQAFQPDIIWLSVVNASGSDILPFTLIRHLQPREEPVEAQDVGVVVTGL
jgi:hypothetical protein